MRKLEASGLGSFCNFMAQLVTMRRCSSPLQAARVLERAVTAFAQSANGGLILTARMLTFIVI